MRLLPGDVLLVVDVQRDFLPGGPLAVPDGDAVVAPINRLGALFEHVLLTQDWHPAAHVSFAANHPGRAPFEQIELSYGRQVLWPTHWQGVPPRGGQLLRLHRSGPAHAHGPCRLPAGAWPAPAVPRGVGHGLLRGLERDGCRVRRVRGLRH